MVNTMVNKVQLAEEARFFEGIVLKGQYDKNYEGPATIDHIPTEFTLAQLLLPWKKIEKQPVLQIQDSASGVTYGIPLKVAGVSPDPETASNLELLLQESQQGHQLNVKGSAIIRTGKFLDLGAILSFGMTKEELVKRQVYTGSVTTANGIIFSFYVDLSPQFRQYRISRV